jgi:hypothetical protein
MTYEEVTARGRPSTAVRVPSGGSEGDVMPTWVGRRRRKLVYPTADERKRLMKKKILAALAMSLLAGALVIQAPPAHADTFAGGAECKVHLNVWPAPSGTATCSGNLLPGQNAVGVGVHGGSPVVCVPGASPCTFTANVSNYTEPCLPAGIPPPAGTATGTFTVTQGSNSSTFGFTWVRVGVAAVLVPALGGESAGVAAFVPVQTNLGTCLAPAPLDAEVVGVAAGDNLL